MKVLIIDNWTQGVRNLERFFQGIPKLKLKLLHFESIYYKDQASIIKSSKIEMLDLSKNIVDPYEVLKKEKPDLVVFQDIISVPLISFNIAAKNLNIKTFHITHGIPGNVEIKYNLKTFLKKIISSFNRNFFYFYPIFFLAIIKSKNFWKNLNDFLKIIFFQISTDLNILKKINFLETNYGFVYNLKQKKFFRNYYKIKNSNILITGYIPLKKDQYKSKSYSIREKNSVIYLSTSIYQFIFKDENSYVNFLENISNFFKKNNFNFIVKLREIFYHKRIAKKLSKKKIRYIFDNNATQKIAESKLVISEPTTYFYIAALFNKAIFFNKIGVFSSLIYSDYLTNYPYSKHLKNFNFREIKKFLIKKNKSKILKWKRNNLAEIDHSLLVKKILTKINRNFLR